MPGTMIGHYEVIGRIGSGGFATVYQARDVHSGETVALKVLHAQYAQDQEFVRRFRKEGELIRNLPDNPHLVKPKEQSVEGETCYLAMEYVEGQDLDELLARRGSLSFEEATSIASQVAEALGCAHRQGVIHRDIKPQNIKITPTGVVKVLDFGIARATEGTKLTQTGAALLAVPIGTPQYMAPEVWEGKPADCRTDVYALGLVLPVFLRGPAPPAPGHLSVLLSAALALAHRGQLRRVWCLPVLSGPQFPLPYPLRSGRAAMGKTEVNG